MIRTARCQDVVGLLKAPESVDPLVRVYLCGRVMVERGAHLARDTTFAGGQARQLLAYLATRRAHPVARIEVIEALWGAHAPDSADRSLNVIVSKLRTSLRQLGIPAPHGVATEPGTYQWSAPATWVDSEAARAALDEAEGALRQHDCADAWAAANVAAAITSQPFLVDVVAPWASRERDALQRVWRRASIVLSIVSTSRGEYELGIHHAGEALAAEPFDERACQCLMRAHHAAGNRAEALRVFARCRQLFRDELGAEPSAKTSQVFLEILRARTEP
jgi:DNA-binding SARP family transcriptional activator